MERHSPLREGVLAGMIGAASVALWFLTVDSIAGRPFFTPAVLGASIFDLLGAGFGGVRIIRLSRSGGCGRSSRGDRAGPWWAPNGNRRVCGDATGANGLPFASPVAPRSVALLARGLAPRPIARTLPRTIGWHLVERLALPP